jgi:DNA-directed RNA polymerase specialized sigma24 family protein
MDSDLQTASLHDLVSRHRAGDRAALDVLIRRTGKRLERLARKMLGTFPAVQAREETDDVLQNALIRLTRALGSVTPASVRDYYRLAAEELRRELLDLARRHDNQQRPPAYIPFKLMPPLAPGSII